MDSPRFQPGKFMVNAHLQTVWSRLFRPKPRVARRRERLILDDGDFVDLDWAGTGDKALVIILHGLTGSSDSLYVLGLQQALTKVGIGSLAMNFRGCSGEPNRTMKFYHSGETGDLAQVFTFARQRYPDLPMAAVGYSLGGNMLMKWLGESAAEGRSPNLQAAVGVSIPYLLASASASINIGISRIYRDSMLKDLKAQIMDKRRLFTNQPDSENAKLFAAFGDVKSYKTFQAFDGNVVTALYGFNSAEDYYEKCSSQQFLQHIQVPSLLIHSADDPFLNPSVIPTPEQLSASVTLELYDQGGHVGFIGGHPLRPRYWLEQRIPGWLETRLLAPAKAAAYKHSQDNFVVN